MAQVGLDGVFRNDEPLRDARRRIAEKHELEHVALAIGEIGVLLGDDAAARLGNVGYVVKRTLDDVFHADAPTHGCQHDDKQNPPEQHDRYKRCDQVVVGEKKMGCVACERSCQHCTCKNTEKRQRAAA